MSRHTLVVGTHRPVLRRRREPEFLLPHHRRHGRRPVGRTSFGSRCWHWPSPEAATIMSCGFVRVPSVLVSPVPKRKVRTIVLSLHSLFPSLALALSRAIDGQGPVTHEKLQCQCILLGLYLTCRLCRRYRSQTCRPSPHHSAQDQRCLRSGPVSHVLDERPR